jgi:threonine dehydratase
MAATATVSYAASLDDIKAAAERIATHAHITPVLTSSTLDRLAGGHKLHFKCEIFQKGGAFKFRGAFNSVQQLSADQAAKGVVTHRHVLDKASLTQLHFLTSGPTC